MTASSPILVTGAHRAGTSWVGRMLVAGRQAALISEPFNRFHPRGVMRASVPRLYTYVCEENEAGYLEPMRETLAFRYHYRAQFTSHPLRELPRALRDAAGFLGARLGSRRALVKDPFAVFSAPWFSRRLRCRVVVVVRHPVAFASSLKRLGWSFEFGDLLAQPLLMDRLLSSLRGEMELLERRPQDLIGQASLLWRAIYGTVASYRAMDPHLEIVRHEDLSLDPCEGFGRLYRSLGLSFSARARRIVVRSTGENNPRELAPGDPHAVRLNSRANLQNWKHRLTSGEIERVLEATRDLAHLFYSDGDWDGGSVDPAE